METPIYNPCTVDQVFRDFKGRRAAMLKALTTDVELFFRKCDPEKENLCLYGFPDETWEVSIPAEEVPPELPEPALGINFARDGMERKDWLSLVAVHSDAWLFAVAFYYGARFDKNERERLFNMMNELPTVFDIVTGRRTASKDNRTGANSSGNKAKSATKPQKKTPENHNKRPARQATPPSEEEEDEEDEEEEHGDTYCGICAHAYTGDEFWIGCDICQKWFHGKCVKVTPARAEHIKQYKCPSCSNKRARV